LLPSFKVEFSQDFGTHYAQFGRKTFFIEKQLLDTFYSANSVISSEEDQTKLTGTRKADRPAQS
jgi:hypothetical protein